MASSSTPPSSLKSFQNICILLLTIGFSFLAFHVLVKQQSEINQLKKQVVFLRNLWFGYEMKSRGVQVRSSREVVQTTTQSSASPPKKLEFLRDWINNALPPGCEDEEFHRQWLLEMESYYWNRIAPEFKRNVYLYCNYMNEEDNSCEQFTKFLQEELPHFNYTLLEKDQRVLASENDFVLNVVNNVEGLSKFKENSGHLIAVILKDCNQAIDLTPIVENNYIVKFSQDAQTRKIRTCDDSVLRLSFYVMQSQQEAQQEEKK